MPPQLVALTEGPHILLDKPILLLGRHPECDIQIDSRKISRRHCCIGVVHDYLVIRDLGSTNGIRINGQRVLEGKLKASDELTIGASRYQVRWDALDPGDQGRDPVIRAREPIAEPDDRLLESCDEPVALPDPDNKIGRPAPVGGRHGMPPPLPHFDDEDSVPAHELDDISRIVPDDLRLAPFNDSKPSVVPPPVSPSSASSAG